MFKYESIPEPLKWLALSALLFISGFITRAVGEIWDAKQKRKNWMKPRPKTWEEARAEEKEEQNRERRRRNAEALQLSDEELEKLQSEKSR